MRVGFTGTQVGMTDAQKRAFDNLVAMGNMLEFHHADCIGADANADKIVRSSNKDILIVVHPPTENRRRAFVQGTCIVRQAKPYLDRNHDIVDETEMLIACPRERREVLWSGTWATIRYARKQGRLVRIIWPDGTIGHFN